MTNPSRPAPASPAQPPRPDVARARRAWDTSRMMPTRHASRGFTLMELMLVLVILAILAALVVPRMAGRSEQSRITAAKTDIATLEASVDLFEIDTGRFPSSQESLRVLVEQPANLTAWKGPYLKRAVPADPWGNPYLYRQPGLHNADGYDLSSNGPNGQEGDADDITNWTQR